MIRREAMLGCVLALGLGVTACDGGEDPVDSGPSGGEDAGMMMMMMDPPPTAGVGAMRTTLMPADLSCQGTATAPAGGSDVSFTVTAEDFFSDAPVEGLSVDFFADNNVTATCGANCTNVTTSATGTATVMAPEGGWYAYRINAGSATHEGGPEDYVTAVQYNEAAPAADGEATLNAVRQSTVNTLTAALLINQQPGTSVITGQALDCMGRPIANTRVRVFTSEGEVAFGTSRMGPKRFYFNGMSSPLASETETHVDGLYGAGNVPVVGDGMVRVEIWAVTSDGGDYEMVGCERVQAIADGLTIINVGPQRSDGPSDCSG